MKKVEIVIEESVLDKVVDILNENDLLAQTELVDSSLIKKNTTKATIFSSRTAKSLSVICSNKQKDKLVARLFPLINMFGGFCASYDMFY
ncbi:MAG TPA: hypothetical protein VK766_04520 [Cytophagaceae bacterium]|jgi:hypothetical protein|nr:hypothetical protein [Cytophagaceae bacterium]